MNSHTSERFRKLLAALPKDIQKQAKKAYFQFKKDPYHPSLNFKRIHTSRLIFSVRVSMDYRAVCIEQKNELIWFWIGTHSEYDKIVKQLNKI